MASGPYKYTWYSKQVMAGFDLSMFILVHPQNVQLQNVQLQNVQLQEAQLLKVQIIRSLDYQMSSYQTFQLKTSILVYFKTSFLFLFNYMCQKRQVCIYIYCTINVRFAYFCLKLKLQLTLNFSCTGQVNER
jgi:hypothetical protein